jgi:hypothetical protein
MQEDDLKAYVKSQVKSPDHLNEIIRRGFIEIDFDPISEDQIADNTTETVEEKIRVMEDAIKELTSQNTDVNLVGFEGKFKKLAR